MKYQKALGDPATKSGGFFSEIILGAIVGYIVVLIAPIFLKITKVFKK
ncbi:hypothetical protein [Aliarcobacter cryaerophilus]|nr:hypothetical protein [Aliarcobacter cryaerophilus]